MLKFGLVADSQYGDVEPWSSRHYRASVGKLAECVGAFNDGDLDFVVQLGDLIERDFGSFDATLAVLRGLKAPTYHVLGNHDYAVDEARKRDVPARLGVEAGPYDFGARRRRCVVLDGNEISLHAAPRDSQAFRDATALYEELEERGARNAMEWNGGVSASQIGWLERTLGAAAEAGERTIVFCHYPVWPEDAHNLWNAGEVLRALDAFTCVAACISGHKHNGGYAERNGVHHLALQGMVETADENAFAVVEVHHDHLRVVGYGREPDRLLKLRTPDDNDPSN